jgi:hypothetical protein
MRSESESQQNVKQFTWSAWDPEAILYFLLGVGLFGSGTVALFRWALDSWQLGQALPGLCIVSAAIIVPIAFVVFIRRHRRILALGAGMVWLGIVAFAMASFGFSLPATRFG